MACLFWIITSLIFFAFSTKTYSLQNDLISKCLKLPQRDWTQMKDLSMQFLNLTNFFPLSHLKVKLLMKTGEQRIMIKVVCCCWYLGINYVIFILWWSQCHLLSSVYHCSCFFIDDLSHVLSLVIMIGKVGEPSLYLLKHAHIKPLLNVNVSNLLNFSPLCCCHRRLFRYPNWLRSFVFRLCLQGH